MSVPRTEHVPRIVVGVDGSTCSINALRWAIRQTQLTDATLDAVIAWQYPVAVGGIGWAPATGMDDTDYGELAAKALGTAIAQVAPPSSVRLRQLVVEGNAAQALLDAAKGADLLVVGSHGHGGFADALLGSISHRCVRHARCPVVVVHSAKSKS